MNRNKKGSASQKSPPKQSPKKGNKKKKNGKQKMARGSLPRMQGRTSATSVFGDRARYSSTSGEIPAAFVNIDSNSTFCQSRGSVIHPYTGVEGVAFVGCQPFSTIGMTNTASDASVFTTNTLATVTNDSSAFPATVSLSPDNLNGRLAAIANLYSQFVFRDIVIEYVSNCATSQADSFCIAYDRDASQAINQLTFSNIRQITPSLTVPFRTDRAYFHFHYPGNEIWYQAADVASVAGNRLTHQGSIIAYADKLQGNVSSLGYTNIWYVVELYNPVSSQSITLSAAERELVSTYRKSVASSSSSSLPSHLPALTPEVRNGRWVTL